VDIGSCCYKNLFTELQNQYSYQIDLKPDNNNLYEKKCHTITKTRQ